ncbi:RNHCP domain-containing protein [Desulfuribacillus alkaliarsenatis]|uniref:RNHCP domain-containing protein n=1 Tax=Desulfuribacillus alkaliarsenatis TaxID=766136 RepID=A0A1E5G686_9FIRM|nr:RNHCP domain-containing protein [Desulfuribacillus alkaliarsenatis]OEF98692.1 hypothetical protein BHF68_03260 [Desulfuribacillus alkaliarsenatis]
MSERRKTKHINEAFTCENCDAEVPPIIGGGCRNHCPFCLVSKHVDNIPGDRQCMCNGLLMPIDIEYTSAKGYMIIHKCDRCGMVKRNKTVMDSKGVNDSLDKVLEIMSKRSI